MQHKVKKYSFPKCIMHFFMIRKYRGFCNCWKHNLKFSQNRQKEGKKLAC